MAAQSLSPTSIIRPEYNQFNPNKPTQNALAPNKILQSQWLGSISRSNLSLQTSKPRPFYAKLPSKNFTISFSLPIADPERVGAPEKIPKWSSKAIKSYGLSFVETRKIKCLTTGTEALLLAILNDGTNLGSQYLRANGITLMKVRDEIIKMRGKPKHIAIPEFPPLTEAAQKALDWAMDEKLKSGEGGEITTIHILAGVWQQEKSDGHQILAALGFNDEKAKELQSLISDPGFVEL